MRLPSWQFIWRDGGQSLVLVALSFSLLCAGGAMGIDIGRFYAERRFLQDATDAASLACAINKTRGGTSTTAWQAGDDILQNRLLHKNPLGLTVTYAARGSETYDDNIVSDVNLNSGILPTALGCRVAVTVAVPTYLMKIVGPAFNTISQTTRSYAKAKGGFLPSVIKRYLNQGDADDTPGDDGSNEFVDTTAEEGFDQSCHAYTPPQYPSAPGCIAASTAIPGRELVLFGASQKADNDSSFRGYIGLDVRDFSTESPPNSGNLQHQSYNGVAQNATVNTLKDFEATWIGEGYPGPDICAITDPNNYAECAQIAVVNGSSSGIFVNWYQQYFQVGQIGLFQLYDGQVKSVPDFTFTPPTLTVPSGGSVPSKTLAFTMSSQFKLSGSTICTDIVPDDGSLTGGSGDTTLKNPFRTGAINYSGSSTCSGTGVGNLTQNPVPGSLPNYSQTLSGMTASGAQQGIYEVLLRGQASAPYQSRIHFFPAKVTVGNQNTEYDISSSESQKSISAAPLPPPATTSWNIVVGTNSGSAQWHTTGGGADGPITVSWEGCPVQVVTAPATPATLGCYIGTVGTTSTTVTAGTTVSVTVNTASVATQNTYIGWIRTVGLDNPGHPVVKLWKITLDVDQNTGGTSQYVDVIGYAAYEITHMDSNDVYGRAVTGAYEDPNDPALNIAKKIVLVPWETSP